MSWVAVRADALKRARLVDADMEWPAGLAIGKMVVVWQESQSLYIEVASKARIALWAGMSLTADFDRWLAICMSKGVHFFEEASGDQIKIVGNETEIKKLKNFHSRAKRGGDARGEQLQLEAELQAQLEAKLEAKPVGELNGSTFPSLPFPIKTTKRTRLLSWEETDPLRTIFANLQAFPKYWSIFDREKDRKVVEDHMQHHKLSIGDLEEITRQLRLWADGCAKEIKSPRGTLATFVRHYADRKAKEPAKKEWPVIKGARVEDLV